MNIENWFQSILPISRDRIYREIGSLLADYNERNVLYSSATFANGTYKGIEVINIEVIEIIAKLSALKLSKQDWKKARKELSSFISDEYSNIISYFEKKNFKIKNYFNDYFKEKYENHKNESIGLLDLAIEVQMQVVNDRRTKAIWSILNIVLTASIGGLIGGYISNFIFISK